ncbi:YheU family protein [Pseudohalioglobus sediminis]|uniref:YheU family protein n=1 Tax=Pseudohalioglobus sediminis TaxID=2606449 RepID=UPI0021D00787|nr:YheU family protein [Pseudohalioglobus sediminis]
MSAYIQVPVARLEPAALQNLLEEYASRDGTDYGELELTLAEKVGNLRRQLQTMELCLLYHLETEEWDLLPADQAERLLQEP